MNEKKELLNTNLELCQKGLDMMRVLKKASLELGRILMEIRDTQAFSSQWESFADYLAEEKFMSEANASKLITVYNRFIIKMKEPYERVAAIDWTVAYELHRLFKDDNELKDAFDNATILNTSHLRQMITEKRTGITQETCLHSDTYTIRVCKICGQREKIYDK